LTLDIWRTIFGAFPDLPHSRSLGGDLLQYQIQMGVA
jgi:hypothetical protein